MTLIGGCRSPFEPSAHRSFRHPHPLCHFSLRQALRTQGCHLLIAIITTSLTCLMGFLHVGRSTLLPCSYRWQRTGALFCGLLRGWCFSLADFRTAVPKDLLEHLLKVFDDIETIYHLLRLGRAACCCFGQV